MNKILFIFIIMLSMSSITPNNENEILSKYSEYNITIEPHHFMCGKVDALGCIDYETNVIQVVTLKHNPRFEFVILHEIAHLKLQTYNETLADEYAYKHIKNQ